MCRPIWICAILWSGCGLNAALASGQTAQEAGSPSTDARPAAIQSKSTELEESRRLLSQGRYQEALTLLQSIQQADPQTPGLSHALGEAYYKKGDYVNAITALNKAREEAAGDQEAVQLLGISYYLAGRPADAIASLEQVQAWFPSANVDAAYILGICYIQTKDYPRARVAFAKMFGVPEESAASYLFTARMLLRQDIGPIAEDYARKAAALDPKLPLVHFLLGELDLYHSKMPEAITEFEKEAQLNPGYAATYYKLADAYSRIQKYDEAEKLLQRSIWLDATSTGPYILMGKVLEKKGEPELAVRALLRALTMDPNNPIPHHLLGQAYRDLGKSEDAERELKIAGQLEQHQDVKP
jgi:tetratricopeptide (TPR) repeat protein